MSAQLGTTTTVTFHKPGTTPPVFLAGSFVSPSWKQPQEMSYVHERDSDGENVYIFSSTVHVAHGHDYQYKFRIGQGPWVLDETNHVATDDQGNKNNFVTIPPILRPAAHPVSTQILSHHTHSPVTDMSTDRSSTPADKVADTAADVADTAQELDGPGLEPTDAAGSPEHHEPKTPLFSHENLSSYESMLDGSRQDTRSRLFSHEDLSPYDATVDDSRQDPRCRLFSHESLGAYEPLDDDIYNECPDMAPATPEPLQRTKSSASSFAVDDATDMNDPTIETFPSDRLSVMSTLRKIQSSSSQDHAVDVQEPYSPRFGSGTCNSGDPRIRRLSGDSADDGSNYLAEPPINHKMVPFPRRRDSRASHGSLDRGATSLGAIAEEPKKVAGNPSTTQY